MTKEQEVNTQNMSKTKEGRKKNMIKTQEGKTQNTTKNQICRRQTSYLMDRILQQMMAKRKGNLGLNVLNMKLLNGIVKILEIFNRIETL